MRGAGACAWAAVDGAAAVAGVVIASGGGVMAAVPGSVRIAAVGGGTVATAAADGDGDGAADDGALRDSGSGAGRGTGCGAGEGGGVTDDAGGVSTIGAGGPVRGSWRAPRPAGSTGAPGAVTGVRCCIAGATGGVSGNCRPSKPRKITLSGFEDEATWPRI